MVIGEKDWDCIWQMNRWVARLYVENRTAGGGVATIGWQTERLDYAKQDAC
jgi:hypothetical protein